MRWGRGLSNSVSGSDIEWLSWAEILCGAKTWNISSFLHNFLTISNFWCLKWNDAANAAEVNGSNKWKCEQWGVAGSRVFSAQFAVCEQHRCGGLESGSFCGCSRSQVPGKQAELVCLFFLNFSCLQQKGHLVLLISSYLWWCWSMNHFIDHQASQTLWESRGKTPSAPYKDSLHGAVTCCRNSV